MQGDGESVNTEAELAEARRRIAELTAALDAQAGPHRQADGAPLNSHQLLEAIFENDHVGVAILDPTFRFVRVNRAYARADGREPGFFAGKGHFELYPDPDNEAVFRRVVATGEPHTALARPFEHARSPERGVTHWDWTLAPHKGPDGAVVRLSLIVIDVTDRIRGMEAAARSEARYRSLAEAVPVGVFRTDAKGRRVFVNEHLCRLTGRDAAYLTGETGPGVVHPDDRDEVVRRYREAVAAGGVFEAEYRYRRPDGEVVWVYTRAEPERDPDGALTGYVGSVTDITGRRRAQEALGALASAAAPDLEAFARESARHLARAYGTHYAFMGLLAGEEPERVRTLAFWADNGYVKNVTYDLAGTPCEDIVAGRLTLVPDRAAERYPEDKILADMGVESYFGAPLVGADGRTVGLVGVLDTRPMTPLPWTEPILGSFARRIAAEVERHRAERRLLESERSLARAQRVAHLGHWEWDIPTGALAWSDQIYRIFGLDPQQFGATYEAFLSAVHPDDREYVQAEVAAAVDPERRKPYSIDHRIVLPDGEVRAVHEQGEVTFDPADGTALRMVGTVHDITDQHRAQQAMNALAEASVSAGTERFFRVCVRALADAYGARHAFVGLLEDGGERRLRTVAVWAGDRHGDDFARDLSGTPCAGVVAGNVTLVPDRAVARYPEDPLLLRLGAESYFGAPLVDSGGRTLGVVAVVDGRPMTLSPWTEPILGSFARRIAAEVERGRAEARLRESEASLARAQEIAHLGHWEWDAATDQSVKSDEAWRIVGLPPAPGGLSRDRFLELVHPDDREMVQSRLEAAMDPDRRAPFSAEFRLVRPSGDVRHVHEQASVTFDDAGRPVRMIGTIQDVTDPRRAAERVRRSERELAAILDNLQDTYYRTDLEGRVVRVSASVKQLLGYRPEELMGRPMTGLYVEPDGRDRFLKALETAGGRVRDHQAAIRARDGRQVWVSTNAQYVRDAEGRVAGVEGTSRDITENRRMAEALRESEARLAETQAIAHLGSWEWDVPAGRMAWSAETYRIYGRADDGVPVPWAAFLDAVHPDDRGAVERAAAEAVERGEPFHREHRVVRPDGAVRVVRQVAVVHPAQGGAGPRVLGAVQDITDLAEAEAGRERARAQLLQAQKMEAVGLLAGGVAHDFNNLLTTIMGYAELAVQRAGGPEDPLADHLNEIRLAADRAASLTRQLLLFSRRQPMAFAPLDVSERVRALLNMLDRLIGEDVEVHTELADDLWPVRADGVSIDQMVMNLAINARDAMPEGGRLTIRTGNLTLSEAEARVHPEAAPGPFVRVTVSDTGMGMDAETLARVFEPFFTTKELGKGTGLGMSVAHGIVKQHGGWIQTESAPGRGTTFHIHLPAASRAAAEPEVPLAAAPAEGGAGHRVLVVEDEEALRAFARAALTRNGYRVADAATADEALALFEREGGAFALVFSDVVLPDRSGLKLVDELKRRRPDLNVLLCSGYPDPQAGWSAVEERGLPFIQKPYSLADLLSAVAEGVRGAPAAG